MHYHEHEPHKHLKTYIKCYWSLKVAENLPSNDGQKVLTDGMEFIFNLAAPCEVLENGSILSTVGNTGITGPRTVPMKLRPTGPLEMFGICFLPGGSYPFFSIPLHELTNQYADVDSLWGAKGSSFVDRIINTCFTTKEKIVELDKYLLNILEKNRNDDIAIDTALRGIQGYKGQVTVEHLAQHTGLSCRQLERKFKERVGISPKQLSRSLRFKNIFKYLERSPYETWTSVALACGYYDQAHMIRDFKHYTGLSPVAYFNHQPEIGMERFFTGNF